MSEVYHNLATALIKISLAGAAIVYSKIFRSHQILPSFVESFTDVFFLRSAARGNVGLMVFSFSLFSVGFIIPALTQLGLYWAQLSRYRVPFASQTFWRITIGSVSLHKLQRSSSDMVAT